MKIEQAESKTHTLAGGELVYLYKPPGGGWTIKLYELGHSVTGSFAEGHNLKYREGRLPEWDELQFDTPELAVEHVEQLVYEQKLPRNPK